MIPQILLEMAAEITNQKPVLPSGSGDGRSDSVAAEDKVIGFLQNWSSQNSSEWRINSSNIGRRHNRSWYDFSVDNGHKIFCDIKVSDLKGQDNTNAKLAIYYFLTGKDPDKAPRQWSEFFEDMSSNEKEDDNRDYYYLVVSKKTRESFVVSLKGIAKVRPAHNNPPFQCKWDECRTPISRTWQEARDYLLCKWAKSINNGIQALESGMPKFYPDFFN